MADKAIDIFKSTFRRGNSQIAGSLHILKAFNESDGEKEYGFNDLNEVSDMARFGVVLAVAAMDDYFTRKYAEVFVPVIKKRGINDKCAEMLEDAGLDLKTAIELIAMSRPYRRIRKLAQDYYQNYTTQNVGKIDELFRTIGIFKLTEHAERRAKRTTLLASVNKVVKRRHKIVHAGDRTRTGKLQEVDLKDLKKRFEDIYKFVIAADKHIEDFKKQKC